MDDSGDIGLEASIVAIVNCRPWRKGLAGLSTVMIEEWVVANRLDPDSMLVHLVYQASEIFSRLLASEHDRSPAAEITDDLRSILVAISREIEPAAPA